VIHYVIHVIHHTKKVKTMRGDLKERVGRFFEKPLPRFFFFIGLPLATIWILFSIVFYKLVENDWSWVESTFYSVNVFMGGMFF
jgi:hypothetical protein